MHVNISLLTSNLYYYKNHPPQAGTACASGYAGAISSTNCTQIFPLLYTNPYHPNPFLSRAGRGRRLRHRERVAPTRYRRHITITFFLCSFILFFLILPYPLSSPSLKAATLKLIDKISRIYSLPPPFQHISNSQDLFIDF